MSPKSFAEFSICFATNLFLLNVVAFAFQVPNAGGNANPNFAVNPLPNNGDGFTSVAPVMTFVDPNSGQSYGRYVTMETVPDVEYSYQTVIERVYVPRNVTENRTMTIVKYTPIQSYQLQLQNVPGWNPFASPQQVWQYVPIVQYQPNYEQVNQPVTYVKYEEQERKKEIPVLSATSKQVKRFSDRPLGATPNGGNTIAASAANNFGAPTVNNPNVIQNAAEIAQANRNLPRYATRPIGYPASYNYQGMPNRNLVAQAPMPYYPNPANAPGAMPTAPTNAMLANAGANNLQAPSNFQSPNNTIPLTPMQPNMSPALNSMAANSMAPNSMAPNSMAGYNGYPAGSNPYYASTPYQGNASQTNPYMNTASRPLFSWPSFATGTGSLFGNSMFTNNRSTNYVASNTQVSQPYLWGNSTTSNASGPNFRPNSSPYVTPQQSWGVSSDSSNRDPMQGGMPATVLR
jgi:hypothetical protein